MVVETGHWNFMYKYSGDEGLVWLMAACTTGLLVRRTQVSADDRTVSIAELKKFLKNYASELKLTSDLPRDRGLSRMPAPGMTPNTATELRNP